MPTETAPKSISDILAAGYAEVAAGRQWTAEHEAAKKLADAAPEMRDSLSDNLRAWEDEEESVQEEHAEVIQETRVLLDRVYAGK